MSKNEIEKGWRRRNDCPTPTYQHTFIEWNDHFYVFGGKDTNEHAKTNSNMVNQKILTNYQV